VMSKKRILVVDDEQVSREGVGEVLHSFRLRSTVPLMLSGDHR
jgi:hypothetical protein